MPHPTAILKTSNSVKAVACVRVRFVILCEQMKKIYSLPIAFYLILLASDASDLKVKPATGGVVDLSSASKSNNNNKSSDKIRVEQSKTDVIGSRLGKFDNSRSNSSKRSDSREGVRKGKLGDAGVVVVGKSGEGAMKDGFQGEECGSSNKCRNEKTNLVACFRVVGNESSNLTLLMQNKEESPLRVAISAPRFVQLEQTQIQLGVNESRKVGVSVANGNAATITLMTQNGSCKLDFKELIQQNSRKAPKLSYDGYFRRTHSIALISIAALLMVASVWMCVNLRKKHLSIKDSKYQKLNTALPVSGMALEIDSDTDNGWDNSWGNSWDDIEDVAKTPTMPITPSFSSKGLASRRLNKEGWKD